MRWKTGFGESGNAATDPRRRRPRSRRRWRRLTHLATATRRRTSRSSCPGRARAFCPPAPWSWPCWIEDHVSSFDTPPLTIIAPANFLSSPRPTFRNVPMRPRKGWFDGADFPTGPVAACQTDQEMSYRNARAVPSNVRVLENRRAGHKRSVVDASHALTSSRCNRTPIARIPTAATITSIDVPGSGTAAEAATVGGPLPSWRCQVRKSAPSTS